MTLLEAPNGRILIINHFEGNADFLKNLSIQNLHVKDKIKKMKGGFLGPLLIIKIQEKVKIALGKDIAQKIYVEIIDENS
jgi:Fe2+ transport system protein FeoA